MTLKNNFISTIKKLLKLGEIITFFNQLYF